MNCTHEILTRVIDGQHTNQYRCDKCNQKFESFTTKTVDQMYKRMGCAGV